MVPLFSLFYNYFSSFVTFLPFYYGSFVFLSFSASLVIFFSVFSFTFSAVLLASLLSFSSFFLIFLLSSFFLVSLLSFSSFFLFSLLFSSFLVSFFSVPFSSVYCLVYFPFASSFFYFSLFYFDFLVSLFYFSFLSNLPAIVSTLSVFSSLFGLPSTTKLDNSVFDLTKAYLAVAGLSFLPVRFVYSLDFTSVLVTNSAGGMGKDVEVATLVPWWVYTDGLIPPRWILLTTRRSTRPKICFFIGYWIYDVSSLVL